jgi:RHS repeat-associated protein
MRRIKFIVTKFFIAACLLLLTTDVDATDDPQLVTTLSGLQIVNGAVGAENIDNVFYDPTLYSTILNANNDKITNVVSLLIDEALIGNIKTDFTASIKIKIDYTLVNGNTGSIASTTLNISYTKAGGLKYDARQTLKFDQCRRVKVTIIDVPFTNANWNVWDVIIIENRMLRKRDYVFDYNSASLIPSHPSIVAADADELMVSWSSNPLDANGKTHIDIEWTWVDAEALIGYQNSSSQFDADLIFKNNASRVSVDRSKNNYKIPLIYDGAGRLFYRIRPFQVRENEQVINGNWSATGTNGILFYERVINGGHQENLNWQTTTSFAEEGKRKTVVQYFDGTLRGRQTVTKDNVTNKTVVAESFYDYQGRPVINILPAPTLNSVIKYTVDFNRFVGSYNTAKEIFDIVPTNLNPCNFETPRLDKNNPNGGSAQYYSDINPEKSLGFNKFIPDADGYSYTETRYTPDATGRIEAQGGVGNTFQLGKGGGANDHDTKYYYGKPDQKELDALFGTEVGDATHYSKNMVRDANGQYSVSYVDMHGRTIATALAGKSPANVKALESTLTTQQDFKKDLVTPSNNRVEGRSVVASTTLLVTQEVPHLFHYELGPLSAEILACNPPGETVCYDCYYNLEIRITGGCGVNIVKTANNLSFVNNLPVYDQSCSTLPAPITFDFTETLKEGEYNITKTLTVNKDAQDWYRENVYNVKNNCKTLQYFYDSIYNVMLGESNECNICNSCPLTRGTTANTNNNVLKNKPFDIANIAKLGNNKALNVGNNKLKSTASRLTQNSGSSNTNSTPLAPAPTPSYCTNPVTLTVNPNYNCGVKTAGISQNATTATTLPLPTCLVLDVFNLRDQWFSFTATNPITRVSLTNINGEARSPEACFSQYIFLSIYTGGCANLTELTCVSDPNDGSNYTHNFTDLVVGNTYIVRVSVSGNCNIPFNVCVGTPPSPPPAVCPPPVIPTCISICDQPKNILEAIRDQMLDDMTPDQGQYARLNLDLNENDNIDAAYNENYARYEGNLDRAHNIFATGAYKNPVASAYNTINNAQVADYLDNAKPAVPDPDGATLKLMNMTPLDFSDNFKTTWATALLPYHPEYCKLTIAETLLKESYDRDALIEETDTWAAALAAGYIDLDEGTSIINLDPFFSCEDRGLVYRTEMYNYIRTNFNRYHAVGYPQAGEPPLSFWSLAWLGVFADEEDNTVANPPIPLFPSEFPNLTTPTHPTYPNACVGDLNEVWRIFRALYLSEKERMVNEWLNTQCPIDYTTIDGSANNKYERRFGRPSDYYANTNYLQNLITQATNNPATAEAETSLRAEYRNTCDAYKAAWATRLRQCEAIKALDGVPTIDPNTGEEIIPNDFIRELLNKLSDICYYGSDAKHLTGSSTLPAGIVLPPGVTVPVSFQAAFNAQWTASFPPKSISCNEDLIDFPPPYDHQASVSDIIIDDKRDSCVCARLEELKAEKIANAYSGSLSNFILFKHGVTVRQTLLDSLSAGCLDLTCKNYEYPFQLPSIFGCNTPLNNCVSCTQYNTLLLEFKAKTYTPALNNNVIYEDPANDNEIEANKAFARFMNNRTGLTKSWGEYLAFSKACDTFNLCTAGILLPAPAGRCPNPLNPPLLCLENMFPDFIEKDSCNQYVTTLALNAAIEQYQLYLIDQRDIFDNAYLSKCLEAKDLEIFNVEAIHSQTDPPAEYHYTLYYYDQAGNLVKTIPPAGVRAKFTPVHFAAVKAARANEALPRIPMQHFLPTQYRYNTLNQVVQQKSPDGGLSKFWYDQLGRLVISQNEKQHNNLSKKHYSYTKYDKLGRITEVGEKWKNANSMTQDIAQGLVISMPLVNWLLPTVAEPLTQITKTIYDEKYTPLCTNAYLCQENMRNRVSYSYVQALEDGSAPSNINDAPWESATFYSYDIHGNVDVLLQDYKKTMGLVAGNRYKKITYKYDLISGKVNEVGYQPGQADAFYHRYMYDAENKLTDVQTSKEYVYWENDAKYDYYRHGPMARTKLGHLEVQGVDYAYTLQGWLKGVNTTNLKRPVIIGNGDDCGDYSAVENLYIYNRPSYSPNYIAKTSINFMPSAFTSLEPDNFVAYIDPNIASCTTNGNAGDEIFDFTNNGKYDMGQDGLTDASGNFVPNNNTTNYGTATNPAYFTYGSNTNVSDAYGYSLNYFNGDYNRISAAANNPFANIAMKIPTNDAANPFSAEQLFNGNIGAMVVSIPRLGRANVYGYNYDQLNRLVNMNVFNGLKNDNTFVPYAIPDYKEAVTYDANGNIKTYERNGHNNPSQFGPPRLEMDKLTYKYEVDGTGNINPQSNKLRYVHDQVADANYAEDIDSQTPLTLAQVDSDNPNGFTGTENYAYDDIGNLIKDTKENITSIEWTVYGKISKIVKEKDELVTTILYTYDASGNRISKTIRPPSYQDVTTYYVRDASGNVMSVYDKLFNGNFPGPPLTQKEIHLYGSSRLGVYNVQVNVETNNRIYIPMTGVTDNQAELFTFARGNKLFELANHLGNVLVTVSDKKMAIDDGTYLESCTGGANPICVLTKTSDTPDGIVDYYKADVITAVDYYPFGMTMPGRKFTLGEYRYGFNGKEKDNEVKGEGNQLDFEMRIYDPRLGRFLSTDPLSGKYPWITPYAFAIDNPIALVDFEGSEGAAPPNENNAPGQIVNIMVVSASLYTKNGDNWASYMGALQGALANGDAYGTTKVIFATNSENAYTQIYNLKAKGVTIGNIILESHGNGGESFDIGLSNFNSKNSGSDPWLKKIGGISSGAIVLMGCQLGMNEKLMKNLAKNTGKNVYADKGENTDWPGMFNDENDRELFANAMATVMWNTPQGKSAILSKASKNMQKAYDLVQKYGTDGMKKKVDEYVIKEATKEIMAKMVGPISPSSALEYITSPDHEHYDLRIPENVEKFNRGGQWIMASPGGSVTPQGLLYFDNSGFIHFSRSTFSQTTWGAFIVELIKTVQPAAPIQ